MTLEDTVRNEIMQSANYNAALRNTYERVKAGKGPSDDGNYNINLFPVIGMFSRDEIGEDTSDILMTNPESLPKDFLNDLGNKFIGNSYKKAKSKLVEKVSPNYSPMLDELDGKELYQLLLESPVYKGSDKELAEAGEVYKEMKKWGEVLEKKDIETYINDAKNPNMRALLEKYKGNKKLMLTLMANRVGYKQQKFTDYFIDQNKLDKKKLAGAKDQREELEILGNAIIQDKARQYLKEATLSAEKDEKEDFLESIGLSYLSINSEREKAKKDKKAKKELEEAEAA